MPDVWAAVYVAEEVGAGLGAGEVLFGAVSAGVNRKDSARFARELGVSRNTSRLIDPLDAECTEYAEVAEVRQAITPVSSIENCTGEARVATKRFGSIDDYIAALPPESQGVASELRALIHDTVSGLTERISYDMPTFDLKGQPMIYFGAWKKHIGFYPANGRVVAHFGEEFAPYKLGPGTIQFPLKAPMPMDLIRRIIEFRANELRSAG